MNNTKHLHARYPWMLNISVRKVPRQQIKTSNMIFTVMSCPEKLNRARKKRKNTHYILCEYKPTHMVGPIKCEYFSRNDGTCLAEKLLCDGKWHCVDGEDEANCTAICSSNEVEKCRNECSYEYNCRCARVTSSAKVEVAFQLANYVTM